jgi:hypothetical protein
MDQDHFDGRRGRPSESGPRSGPGEERASRRERDEDYFHIVARLNERWRVIVCKDGIQWLLQKSKSDGGHGTQWRGRSYCTTRDALIACCARLCGRCEPAALAVLARLPGHIPHDRSKASKD